MSRFPGKKLPPGWVYVPSRRAVRDSVRRSSADFWRVEFAGTGRGPSDAGLLLGYLERRVAGGMWCFYLCLWGAPESVVAGHREELASSALVAIEASVAACLASPPAGVVEPTQLLLRFALEADRAVPGCEVRPVDRYSFSAGRWWESPNRPGPAPGPDM
ncbi:MAG TPA: hypothetical protein VGE74_28745 [Gemmata sp.]